MECKRYWSTGPVNLCVERIEHVVLDMDGTLIGEDHICARPYLREFFEFLFSEFETVTIWTSASKSWYQTVHAKFLKPNMPTDASFFQTWFNDKCKKDPDGFQYKPLSKFFKKYKGFSRSNTVIIDNDPDNYFYDKGNAIPIETYLGTQKDSELLRVMNEMKIKMYYSDLL